jgi:hypothetical protein
MDFGEKALVFVSCGQVTEAERNLGKSIVDLVDRTPGLRAYFAETVSSLEGLIANIFKHLEQSAAFVTVMHHRGTVTGRQEDPVRMRASVWIEQEIAIAAFLKHGRRQDLQVAAYAVKGISLEGAREKLALNPVEFVSEDQVLVDLAAKLARWDLKAYRLEEPRVDVQIDFERVDGRPSGSNDREYKLLVAVANTSAVYIHDIDYRISFPRAFVKLRQYSTERVELGSATHRVFEGIEGVRLRPDDRGSIDGRFTYVIDDDSYDRLEKDMKLPVEVRLYVNGQAAGSRVRQFDELNDF